MFILKKARNLGLKDRQTSIDDKHCPDAHKHMGKSVGQVDLHLELATVVKKQLLEDNVYPPRFEAMHDHTWYLNETTGFAI
jgi:hypothetical protein